MQRSDTDASNLRSAFVRYLKAVSFRHRTQSIIETNGYGRGEKFHVTTKGNEDVLLLKILCLHFVKHPCGIGRTNFIKI